MIRTTTKIDTSGIDAFKQMLDNHAAVVAAVGQRVYDRHAPELLNSLQQEPGAVKYTNNGKLDWTSDRQRKFVMAMYREKGIDKYERTGKLAQGWMVKMVTEGGVLRFVVENPAPQAKFVYGSMAKDVSAAKRFQQRFHQATGWQTVSPVVAAWMERVNAAFKDEFKQAFTTQRRAYTKGTRR